MNNIEVEHYGHYRGVKFRVILHSVGRYYSEGIWCYYIYVDQRGFLNPADWLEWNLRAENKNWGSENQQISSYVHFPYDDLPDIDLHGGPTFGDRIDYTSEAGTYSVVIVGCDYGHYFDALDGQSKDSVRNLDTIIKDAHNSIDKLCEMHPQREVILEEGTAI